MDQQENITYLHQRAHLAIEEHRLLKAEMSDSSIIKLSICGLRSLISREEIFISLGF